MKKALLRVTAMMVVAFMLITICGCNTQNNGENSQGSESVSQGNYIGSGGIVMSYEGRNITESDFNYILSYMKQYYTQYWAYYGYDIADVYGQTDNNGNKYEDMLIKQIAANCQNILVVEKLCADAGLTITDEATVSGIDSYLSDIAYEFGGEEIFKLKLHTLGYNEENIRRYEEYYELFQLLRDYRYGENGVAKIDESIIKTEFNENYVKLEGYMYAYDSWSSTDDAGNTVYTYEISDDEINEYFLENYIKVRHILYKTTDDNNTSLSAEDISAKKTAAEAAMAKIEAGEAVLDDLKEETDDNGYEYVFTKGTMAKEFEEASFEMQVGETRLVETAFGWHIIQKDELTATDMTDDLKTEVTSALGKKKVEEAATAMYEGIKASGAAFTNPAESEKAYTYAEPNLFEKSTQGYEELADKAFAAKDGDLMYVPVTGKGIYIVRKIALTESDLESVYDTIQDPLIDEEFYEYVSSYLPSITVNQEIIDKFDFTTAVSVDEIFFTAERTYLS